MDKVFLQEWLKEQGLFHGLINGLVCSSIILRVKSIGVPFELMNKLCLVFALLRASNGLIKRLSGFGIVVSL